MNASCEAIKVANKKPWNEPSPVTLYDELGNFDFRYSTFHSISLSCEGMEHHLRDRRGLFNVLHTLATDLMYTTYEAPTRTLRRLYEISEAMRQEIAALVGMLQAATSH